MENDSKVYSKSSKAAALSAAVCEVTIEQHMKSYYIDP
jgi:hypothetical protein